MDSLWVKLRSADKVGPDGWLHRLGYLDTHLLLVVLDGEASVIADGCLQRVRAGSAFVGLPGLLLHAPMIKEGELFVFRFDTIEEREEDGETGLEPTKRNSRLPVAGLVPLPDAALAGEWCRRAAADWHRGGIAGRLQAHAAFFELLGRLCEDAGRELPTADAALSRTIDYMDRHFNRNVAIDELADVAGLSRYYYMRLFKTTYGISAMDYLTELRMNRAKQLLGTPKPKMRDIARQVGYNDEFYFIRKFKQHVGIPPATYVRNRRRRVAAYSFPNIGQLLALQIVPFVAPMDHTWTDGYRRKYRTDVVTTLSHEYEFNLTALQAARPDCIIGVDDFVPPEEQERIRAVAPTLFVSWREDDWRGHLRGISEFLDMSAEAEVWLSRYDRLAARTREQVRRQIGRQSVLVVQVDRQNGYSVYGRQTVAGVLYDDLGLAPPERAAAIQSREAVTLEELAGFGADRVLFMQPNAPGAGHARDKPAGAEEAMASIVGCRVTPIGFWPWYDYSAYTQEQFLRAVPALLGIR